MTGVGDKTMDLLVEHGLVSWVRAGFDLLATASEGQAAEHVRIGDNICELFPVLFGLEEQIEELRQSRIDRIEVSNVAMIDANAVASERRDYVILLDREADDYLIWITPSLANDDLSIELEQSLRDQFQLEMRVASQARAIGEANAALKRTNNDLINFTRIISHDLKAPMRAIRYSAEDISASISETDDPMQLEALRELRQQSVRLSKMVTDLLTYSRLDNKNLATADVDTRQLIDAVAASLSRPDTLALEISGDWPQISTINVLLDVVLRNLLDNAIKHHDSGEGQISVVAELGAEHLKVVVMDDGPGIPEMYEGAVLQPFIKVDQEASDSSGLGLSMVDKIIGNVGGRLDIGGRPDGGRGAHITVFWPLAIVAS